MTEDPEPTKKNIWCGECAPKAGPFTEAESKEHNSPTGIHANMWANGSGPGPNYKGRKEQ